jgi:uncharacterized protein YidB (DUF937 family)
MGMIDDLKNRAMSAFGGGNPTVGALLQMLNNHPGGFSGLIAAFQEKGLGGIAGSWVGTGANEPITAEQIQRVLSNEHIQQFAAKLGISPEQASAKIAEYLPQVVDKLTPNGQIPQGEIDKDLLKSRGGKAA